MDVLMPDGTLIQNVPEGVTKAQLQAKLSGASAPTQAPITPDVPLVASQMPKQVPIETKTSMMDKLKALYEVPATMASGAIAQPAGAAYGIYKSVTSPQYGTQAGVEEGRQAGLERGPVPAVPRCARRDGPCRPRAQPLPGRRDLPAARGARRPSRRRVWRGLCRGGGRRLPRPSQPGAARPG